MNPKGYKYSVFNLVYETNVASCRIWDALGFKRIGRVPGCGNLRSHPTELVDALIYGRDLNPSDADDYVSSERFDKIRYFLKHGRYPAGADRAEKSRLRSAATHYKLVGGENGDEGEEKLMLKDKEVISDPTVQYEIAKTTHEQGLHGGINKTTATIAEKYHWVRIKETVSAVIRNCGDCTEPGKVPGLRPEGIGAGGIRPEVSTVGRTVEGVGAGETGSTAEAGSSETQHQSDPFAASESIRAKTATPADMDDMPLDPQLVEGIRPNQITKDSSEKDSMDVDPAVVTDDAREADLQRHLLAAGYGGSGSNA